MKTAFKFFLLMLAFTSLTSCFDVLDKVSLKADGSGEYSIILNASKSKSRIASISKMKTVNGKAVPQKADIERKVAEAAGVFKTVPGISNVQTSADFSNYIIKLSCNFEKIENINEGISRLKAKKILGAIFPSPLFSSSTVGKSFSRNKINTFKSEYDKLSAADKEIFNTAKYTAILQFENTVKSFTNRTYQISPNKKALKLEGNILDFILQKKQFYNTVYFN